MGFQGKRRELLHRRWQDADISCPGANERACRILFHGMRDPSHGTSDQKHAQARAWRKLERDGNNSEGEVDIGVVPNQIGNPLANVDRFSARARVARALDRLDYRATARISIRIERLGTRSPRCKRSATAPCTSRERSASRKNVSTRLVSPPCFGPDRAPNAPRTTE
jgi:hypothetical protein